MKDSTLRKSLSVLTHPLTIAAVLVLLINDHYLRIHYPSWITGKLGDFAWLYISPIALAAILGFLLPRLFNENTRSVILLSVGLISVMFLLGKTSVQVNAWMREGMGLFLGGPVSLHRDPTDLIALPAAAGAYLTWIKHRTPKIVNYRKGLALLVISGALTIANAAEPDYGITCLEIEEGRLIAGNNWYEYYESWDGGLSWEEINSGEEYRCDPYSQGEIKINAPDNDQYLIRVGEGNELEESQDGGKTWAAVPNIQHFSQAEIAWLEGTRTVYYRPGPLAVVSDPGSGSLVFAMGLEGVLVRTEEGEWIPVAVGDYQLVNLTLARIPGLLKYEIILAAVYALLLPFMVVVFTGKSLFQKIWLGLIWVAWLFIFFSQPALRNGYDLFIINAGVIFLAVSTIILVTLYLNRVWESFKTHWIRFAGAILIDLVAVIFPFLLWASNLIPDYRWSQALSLCLGLILLVVRINWTKKKIV